MEASCTFEKSSNFTAGDIVSLICMGKFPQTLGKLIIEFPNSSNKYSLKILSIQSLSNHKLVLKVSGYKPGNYSNVHFIITDGVHSYTSEPLSWTISSILDHTKSVQPYPPYGPWKPFLPSWGFWSLGFIFVILVGVIVSQIRKLILKNKIKRRVSERLKGQTSLEYFIRHITPFIIHKDKWDNIPKGLEELNQILIEFLENQFEIPIELSAKKRVRSIKRRKLNQQQELIKIILELNTLQRQSHKYLKKDGEQMVDMVRNWVFSNKDLS